MPAEGFSPAAATHALKLWAIITKAACAAYLQNYISHH